MSKKQAFYSISKNIIFVLAVVLTALLQNSGSTYAAAGSFGVYLLIPLSVSIAMFEHEFSGFIFGLSAGVLWDIASPVTDGVLTLFLAISACICGLLTHYTLRNTLLSAGLLTAAVSVVYIAISIIFNVLPNGTAGLAELLKHYYLPSFFVTLLILPLGYFFVKAAEKRFRISYHI